MWLSNLSEGEMQSMFFQTLFSRYFLPFLADVSCVSLHWKGLLFHWTTNLIKKKKKIGVPAGSIYGTSRLCVFVGMEGDRGKYKTIPRFQISKGACLHAVIHKLRNWHLKSLKLKILFNHILGNITFSLYSSSSVSSLRDGNSILMNN